MPLVNVPITSGFYVSDDLHQSAQTCVNLYPDMPQTTGARSSGGLLRTPGLEQTGTFPNGGRGRGMWRYEATQRLFTVVGQTLYTVNTPEVVSIHGTILGSERVIFADNGRVLAIIVPGGAGYFYTISTDTLEQINDPVFLEQAALPGGVTSVTTFDQRFVYSTDTEVFLGGFISDNDGKGFPPLAFEDAEFSPDRNQRVLTVKSELVVFGTSSVEYYRNVGDATAFPLVRVPGATINKGATSRNGIVLFDNNVVFLGGGSQERPSIWKAMPGKEINISNPAIDSALQKFNNDELGVATSWTYTAEGSTFVGFNVGDSTFVYDATSSKLLGMNIWHTRESVGGGKWRVEDISVAFNDLYFVDSETPILGRVNRSITRELGETMTRSFSTGYIISDSASFVVPFVELSVTPGTGVVRVAPVGVNTSENPTIRMETSEDGGRVFSSFGSRDIGQRGENLLRQQWRRLGRMQNSFIMRFTSDDLVTSDIQRLDINVNGG